MNRRRLLLVNPVNPARSGFSLNRSSRFPPVGLGIVAALTPPDWEVTLADENFASFELGDADLVGITAFTSAANRAYEIAATCRARGIPVVMGGIHASMRPDEAGQHVDAVVVGEAESVWTQLLNDLSAGNLRRRYDGAWLGGEQFLPPRRDLYADGYMFASIQTSRGCPLDCDFCSVTAHNGRRYRRRPVEQVLDELETISNEFLFFIDDNIIGYGTDSRQQALALFQGMVERGLRKQWFCQASVNVADDQEVLEWAAQAGCRMIFLGIEAEDVDALTEVNKRLNLKRGMDHYATIFDRIHQAGIAVLGAFIFGMDGDTPEKLRHRAQYMIESDVDVMQATVMTPLPGTGLFQRLERENRLLFNHFPQDWSHYDLTQWVHQPVGHSREELWEVYLDCQKRIYDWDTLKRKAQRTLATTGRWEAMEFAYRSNMSYRNIAESQGNLS
jgi:radical SAM superfamily enzyme YgiQ (UPF0313 family)